MSRGSRPVTAALPPVARESGLESDGRRTGRPASARPLEAPAALPARGALAQEPTVSPRTAEAPLEPAPVAMAVTVESTVAVAQPVVLLAPPVDLGKPRAPGAAERSARRAVKLVVAPGATSAESWVAEPMGPTPGSKAGRRVLRAETVP